MLDGDAELISALHCLLMLLPQSDAFQLIRGRLACLPGPGLALPHRSQAREQRRVRKKKHMQEIDFPSLLEHFQVK